MNNKINRQWVLAARPKGMVKETDFAYHEKVVPTLQLGEFLVRNLYVSFEPAMRGWMTDLPSYLPPVPINGVMRAMGVGQVVESRHPDFKPGDFVHGIFGWQDNIATSGVDFTPVAKLPPITFQEVRPRVMPAQRHHFEESSFSC